MFLIGSSSPSLDVINHVITVLSAKNIFTPKLILLSISKCSFQNFAERGLRTLCGAWDRLSELVELDCDLMSSSHRERKTVRC